LEDLEASCAELAEEVGVADRIRRLQLVGAALVLVRELDHLLVSEPVAEPTFQLESALREKAVVRDKGSLRDNGDRVVVPDAEPINRAVRRCAYLLGFARADADRLFADLRRLSSLMAPDAEILRADGWASVGEVREMLPDAHTAVAATHGRLSTDLMHVLGAALGWHEEAGDREPRRVARGSNRAVRAR
jgi:hypothetical protein